MVMPVTFPDGTTAELVYPPELDLSNMRVQPYSSGYGPGFWGPGHDPFTHVVLGPNEVDMAKVLDALGLHSERVSEPSEVIPALQRALAANASGRPAYIEYLCCQYPVYGQWVGRSME